MHVQDFLDTPIEYLLYQRTPDDGTYSGQFYELDRVLQGKEYRYASSGRYDYLLGPIATSETCGAVTTVVTQTGKEYAVVRINIKDLLWV